MIAFPDPWKLYLLFWRISWDLSSMLHHPPHQKHWSANKIPITAPKLGFAEDLHPGKIFAPPTKVGKRKHLEVRLRGDLIPRTRSYLHLLLIKWTNTSPSTFFPLASNQVILILRVINTKIIYFAVCEDRPACALVQSKICFKSIWPRYTSFNNCKCVKQNTIWLSGTIFLLTSRKTSAYQLLNLASLHIFQ